DRTETLTSDKYTVNSSAYVANAAGTYEIVVSLGELQTKYNVTVAQSKVITSIKASGYKSEFAYGESFSAEGLTVTATYSDDRTETLTSDKYTVNSSAYAANTAGTYEIVVTFGELQTKYNVTVAQSTIINSIEISGYKSEFAFGESFSTEGLTVTATYSDGRTQALAQDDYSVDSSAYFSGVAGAYEITVVVGKLQAKYNVTVEKMKRLRLLMIGNSFSEDTTQYIYEIAKSLGITDVVVKNMYIGGCDLNTHYNNALQDKSAYNFQYYNNNAWVRSYTYDTSLKTAITDQDWDYISLQQSSGSSGKPDSYAYLQGLMDYVLQYATNKDVKLLWNMTWAYQGGYSGLSNYGNDQTTMYNAIIDSVKTKVLPKNFHKIIPCGTAIQNARTSFMGDTLTRDGFHLSYDIGRYIAALTLFKEISGFDISKIDYAPSSITGDYKKMCIESANNAVNKPFEITQSAYIGEPELISEEELAARNLVELNWQPLGCAYWNCSFTSDWNKLFIDATATKFVASSKRFTKEEIPVGSLIIIDKGWQYRSDAWKDENKQASRPNNVTVRMVEVTEEWWSDYIYRSFNVSQVGTPSLVNKWIEAAKALTIYVPESAKSQNIPDYYEQDKTLMQSKGIDISSMKRIDQIPIASFYDSRLSATPVVRYEDASWKKKFVSFSPLTKEDLPNGSVIICDSGYQYRPDGWESEAMQANRPGNVTTNIVTVDDAWWGSYIVRGINVAKQGTPEVYMNAYETFNHVRIYIPA
ncbi:MAG: DUF4886 domain-containing protein, partial [Candidatus Neoclostridium sp.]